MANRDIYLNGALLKKNGLADFSKFTNVKLAELSASPDNTSAATVKYVKDQLHVLSSGTVAGQTTQLADHTTQLASHATQLAEHATQLAAHTTQLGSHDTRILAEKARIDTMLNNAGVLDTFAEVVERINSLDSAQGTDILTKFNNVQQQLNLLYSYFNQTQASIAAHVNDPEHPNYAGAAVPPVTTIPTFEHPSFTVNVPAQISLQNIPPYAHFEKFSTEASSSYFDVTTGGMVTATAPGTGVRVKATWPVDGTPTSVLVHIVAVAAAN